MGVRENRLFSRLFMRRGKLLHDMEHDLHIMRAYFEKIDLFMCVQHVDDLLERTGKTGIKSHHIASLQDTLERELKLRVFLSVDAKLQHYFNEPLNAWEGIIEIFPDAQEDIEEMNKCFALSRYTAAVFHSLLVVEHGLIRLGHYIGVTDPKPGWDGTCRELERLLKNRAMVPVRLQYSFLEQTKARLDSMKLAWRNKVNHAAGRLMIEKTGFSDVSAEEVIIACRSFMRHLAEGLPK